MVVDLMFGARLPVFVAWGPELRLVYNEACVAMPGDCHPAAFGQPLAQVGTQWGRQADTPVETQACRTATKPGITSPCRPRQCMNTAR